MITTRYTTVAITLHWLIAIGIIFQFILAWYMTDLPKLSAKQTTYDLFDLGIYTWHSATAISVRAFYYGLHKSIGLSLLVLVLVRIWWRLTHQPPALLSSYKLWEKKFAHAMHHGLYALIFLVPVSGFLMSLNGSYGVQWFGLQVFSGTNNKWLSKLFYEVHENIGIVLLLCIGLHVLGALKHHFLDKDDTLRRMF